MKNENRNQDGTIYIVMDKRTGWGSGHTREEAIATAARWLKDRNGRQGVSTEEVEDLIISEEEARNGVDGIFVHKVTGFERPII